jgi:hypothetical protein
MGNQDPTESKAYLGLIPEEIYALECFEKRFRTSSQYYPLADSVVEQLFALFLADRSLEEIRRLCPQYGLGQIVDAAVRGDWFRRRDEYRTELLQRSLGRAVQTQAEAIGFISDLILAQHQINKKAVLEAIQTGNGEDLEKRFNLRQYSGLIELLKQVTGQNAEPTKKTPIPLPQDDEKPRLQSEASTLRQLAAAKKEAERGSG